MKVRFVRPWDWKPPQGFGWPVAHFLYPARKTLWVALDYQGVRRRMWFVNDGHVLYYRVFPHPVGVKGALEDFFSATNYNYTPPSSPRGQRHRPVSRRDVLEYIFPNWDTPVPEGGELLPDRSIRLPMKDHWFEVGFLPSLRPLEKHLGKLLREGKAVPKIKKAGNWEEVFWGETPGLFLEPVLVWI